MRRLVFLIALLLLLGTLPVRAGHIPVDMLLNRIFTDADQSPYEITAEFDGTLTVTGRGMRVNARAAGSYREWRQTQGALRRRSVKLTTLDLPLLLRPFAGTLRRVIEERIEREEGTLELLPEYDIFILDETGGRIILGGIRRDIVTDLLQRYGRPGDVRDPETRRALARWLYRPAQRELIVRPGGPYMVTVVTDDQGLLYQLVAEYDWGPVETKFDWAVVSGRPIWRMVHMDTATELSGFGRVVATLALRFSNHCFNCRR